MKQLREAHTAEPMADSGSVKRDAGVEADSPSALLRVLTRQRAAVCAMVTRAGTI